MERVGLEVATESSVFGFLRRTIYSILSAGGRVCRLHLHALGCVCVCLEASAQLDLPGGGVAAALGFLSLTGNGVLLSASPHAAP